MRFLISLVVIALCACTGRSNNAGTHSATAAGTIPPFPQLGSMDAEDRQIFHAAIQPSFAGDDTGDPSKSVWYRLRIAEQTVEVAPEYNLTREGSTRLSLLDFRVAGSTLNEQTEKLIVAAALPRGAVPIPAAPELTASLRSYVTAGTDQHKQQTFYSNAFGSLVRTSAYRANKRWVSGTCQSAKPGDVVVFRDYQGTRVKVLIVTSPYLATCLKDPEGSN